MCCARRSRHIRRQNLHILVLRDVNRTILSVGLTDKPTSDAAKNSTRPSAVNGKTYFCGDVEF